MWILRRHPWITEHRSNPANAAIACFVAGWVLVLAAGCTPNRNGIDPPFPYEGRTYDVQEIREVAAQRCGIASTNQATGAGINAFTTDGCSMYPDGEWLACCIAHDMDYWCANPQTTRAQADRTLKRCVADA
ncbi:MAG: hypothetical protein V3R81_10250 [Gammaproteobacteria bacterium]